MSLVTEQRTEIWGQVIGCAVLIAAGIGLDGKRSILGGRPALSEAEVHWRTFLASLQEPGLSGIQLIVSDDHAGLGAVRSAYIWGQVIYRGSLSHGPGVRSSIL